MIFLTILMFPIFEILAAIIVIREFGFVNAFFVWLFAFVLGLGLFRTSSLRLTVGVAKAMRAGKPPELAALDGALIGLAGIFFLIPGYISDVAGVALLVSPIRKILAKRLLGAVVSRTRKWGPTAPSRSANGPFSAPSNESDDASSAIIDVEAVVIEEDGRGTLKN